ncbi:TPA: prolyl oligopeptidase family serine peptidase [Staphylococcus delphini]|uniref:alpha/beta hydrolase family protein n=1 Tax=Staphylococcus delphini TaxID=53344 RepID=UPI0023B2D6F8|nr:prolyl oligopeptidase family serine peptidase [Staphylococcus delphini]MDE9829157.1 prolyl oligopeptidase family serine peptidase [Staphylococcus delphini]HEC2172499.1 prolyl oligopeptidase family serine peptidase [Staphylococcus delphini]
MQVYQLSMNEDRTIYSHVEAANVSQCINICTLEDNEIVKVNVEEVVFLEWLSKNLLLIQTKHNLLTYDITSRQKNEYVFLKDKIRKVLGFSNTYFDYVVQLTIDNIEIKRYYFLNGRTEEIMSVDTISYDFNVYKKVIDSECLFKYKQEILKNLDVELDVISDSWKGNKLLVSNSNLKCSIMINDEVYFKGSGYVDKAYILDEYVLFSFSNFKRPRALYKIMLNKLKECFLVGETSEKLSDTYFQLDNVQKLLIGDRQVPVVKIEPQNFKFKTVIFLHGGPDTYIRNEYLEFLNPMLQNGIEVLLVDYSGSISYGTKFYQRLLNNNGEEALKDIESILIKIRNKCKHIFVIGESFGGYLAIVSAIRFPHIISKSIAINGFTDYRYQYIFSAARPVVKKYFDIKVSKNNPIDLIEKNSNITPLVFIHGIKDVYCPIKQIEIFVEKSKVLGHENIKLIKIEEAGHYSMLPRVMNKFYLHLIDVII